MLNHSGFLQVVILSSFALLVSNARRPACRGRGRACKAPPRGTETCNWIVINRGRYATDGQVKSKISSLINLSRSVVVHDDDFKAYTQPVLEGSL